MRRVLSQASQGAILGVCRERAVWLATRPRSVCIVAGRLEMSSNSSSSSSTSFVSSSEVSHRKNLSLKKKRELSEQDDSVQKRAKLEKVSSYPGMDQDAENAATRTKFSGDLHKVKERVLSCVDVFSHRNAKERRSMWSRLLKSAKKSPEAMEGVVMELEFSALHEGDNSNHFLKWYLENQDYVASDPKRVGRAVNTFTVLANPEAGRELLEIAIQKAPQVMQLEASFAVLIKNYCEAADRKGAFEMLDRMKSLGMEPKVRTYFSLMKLLCGDMKSLDDLELVFEFFGKLKKVAFEAVESRYPNQESYKVLMQSCINLVVALKGENKEWRNRALELFDEALIESKEDVVAGDEDFHEILEYRFKNLSDEFEVKREVSIDPIQGKCENCGTTLEMIQLSDEQKNLMMQRIKEKVRESPRIDGDLKWQDFLRWIERQVEKEPIEYIVDAANVAFKGPGKAWNYDKVDQAITALQKMGVKNIMVILHASHLTKRDLKTRKDQAIVDRLKLETKLYIVPGAMLDDLFWLWAALRTDAFVLTCDLMRDHLFGSLNYRDFRHWRDRKQIKFDFTSSTDLEIFTPKPYSEVIHVDSCSSSQQINHVHIPLCEADRKNDHICVQRFTDPPKILGWTCIQRKKS